MFSCIVDEGDYSVVLILTKISFVNIGIRIDLLHSSGMIASLQILLHSW